MFTIKVKGVSSFAFWMCMSIGIIALSSIDITPLFGVSQKSLTLGSLLMPLAGSLAFWFAPAVAVLRTLCAFATTGSYLALFLYIPGFCGALAWRSTNLLMHIIVPLSCMIAFILHPQGHDAWVYTLYWLIPIALFFVRTPSLFKRALAATFITHAVGSVLWLYMYAIPTHVWHSLLFVVPVERLLFALALVSVYNTAHVVLSILQLQRKGRFIQRWNVH